MKQLFENWRGYVNEQEKDIPTVGEFVDAFEKLKPSKFKQWAGTSAKVLGSLAIGATVAATAGAIVPAAAVGSGAAAAAGAALSQQAISDLMSKLIPHTDSLARLAVSRLNVPDDQREPVDSWLDLDDDLEALIQGRKFGLGKEFTQKWFEELETSFTIMLQTIKEDPSKRSEPITEYINTTATNALIKFLKDKTNISITKGDK
jgi:hypothetical protein